MKLISPKKVGTTLALVYAIPALYLLAKIRREPLVGTEQLYDLISFPGTLLGTAHQTFGSLYVVFLVSAIAYFFIGLLITRLIYAIKNNNINLHTLIQGNPYMLRGAIGFAGGYVLLLGLSILTQNTIGNIIPDDLLLILIFFPGIFIIAPFERFGDCLLNGFGDFDRTCPSSTTMFMYMLVINVICFAIIGALAGKLYSKYKNHI